VRVALQLRWLGLVLAALGATRPLSAQTYTTPDSAQQAQAAAAGAALLHWIASTHGAGEQTVFLKNTSTQLVHITSYEIHECLNLASKVCGTHAPGPDIRPGETVALQRVRPRDRSARWSYQYRFDAAFQGGDALAETGPELPDTARAGH
jgi:hypothetical protein